MFLISQSITAEKKCTYISLFYYLYLDLKIPVTVCLMSVSGLYIFMLKQIPSNCQSLCHYKLLNNLFLKCVLNTLCCFQLRANQHVGWWLLQSVNHTK